MKSLDAVLEALRNMPKYPEVSTPYDLREYDEMKNECLEQLEPLVEDLAHEVEGFRTEARTILRESASKEHLDLSHVGFLLYRLAGFVGYEPPACGHSACRQNWIDTADDACVSEDEEA